MKKPTVGETDKLRALTDDPELRALMEQYYAAKPSEREPYGAFLEVFIAKADALYPDWRETLEAAGERRPHRARAGDTLRAADTSALGPR